VSDTPRPNPVTEPVRAALDHDVVRTVLDQERRLVNEAILLVASGASARVTVGGLRYGEEILDASRALAASSGIRLVALWTDDEHGADIAVEAIDGVEPSGSVGR
jgi:hypothetical protein